MDINFDFLHSLGNGKKVVVYEININDHIRFIAPYEGNFYVIYWLEVSSDGSICCGIRDLDAKKYASGVVQSIGSKKVLDWSKMPEMIEVDDPNRLKKMTFHSSGKIHGPKYGEVYVRSPLNKLNTQEELCLAVFKEPSQYKEIQGLARKKDIPILSIIPKDHPIFLQVLISPKEKYREVSINNDLYQYTAILKCNGIENVGDIVIQLCFNFSDKATYPPYSIMIWPSLDKYS